jgi:predicted metal-dependent hydrolase
VKYNSAEHHKDIGSFKLVYSGRRSIGISVSPSQGIVVRVPFLTSKKVINEVLERKAAWIKKHVKSYSSGPALKPGKKYAEGELHSYMGKEYILRLTISDKQSVFLEDQYINIAIKDPYDSAKVKGLLYKWYKKEAAMLFGKTLSEALERNKEYNFRPAGLTVRSMKRRWGSCTAKGKITLSTELVKLPEECIEYVILHELCHLRHHNHGQEYYKLLNEIFPDWKRVRKLMKSYNT